MVRLLFSQRAARARRTGRRVALLVLAGLMILPGVVLVTHAAWVALAVAHGMAIASLVTGAAWIGAGVAVMAFSRQPEPPPPPPLPAAEAVLPMIALIEAFLHGLALARTQGKGRDDSGPDPR